MTLRDISLNLKSSVFSNIIFGDSWKKVYANSLRPGIIRESLMSAFANSGYIKVVHDSQFRKTDKNAIKIVEYYKNVRDGKKFLDDGVLGNPIIFTRYTIDLSEKVNVLSGFNEMEYLTSTGATQKSASLTGYIIPNSVMFNKMTPIPFLLDTVDNNNIDTAAAYAQDIFNTPPPDPTPLIDLYMEEMRIRKSIKSGKKIYIYGPLGLLTKSNIMRISFDMNSDQKSMIPFSMQLMITDIITDSTKLKENINVSE